MQSQTIDLSTFPRREQFLFFKNLAYPYVGLTAEIDVTDVKAFTRARGESFFLAMNYVVAKAANRIPEFRMRVRGEGIVQYPCCGTSHTLLLPDNTFVYCTLYHGKPYLEYVNYAEAEQKRTLTAGWTPDNDEVDALYFVSAIPWVHYTALIQPVRGGSDSNPRISFGKYEERSGRLLMPLSILAHHSLVDGYHLGLFYQYVDEEMALLAASR
jgi:chloramphenicol O-acetyltransferase type A